MGATLEALHRLQEIALQIAEVEESIARKRRAVERHQKKLREIDADIANREAALKREQMDADRLDLDMKTHDASIAKLRQTLNQAKTNKEYSAILTQLNTEKADNSKLEEKLLAAMTQLDVKRKEIQAVRESRAAEAERIAAFQAEADKAADSARPRLLELKSQRDKAAAVVPAAALGVFDRVAQKNAGEALAQIIKTNPRRAEFACQGCNMALTIEQVNAVMSRDDPVLCNTCGKILYLETPAVAGRA